MGAQNSGGKSVGRPFEKGRSGNPGGRPKGLSEFKRACQAKTKQSLEALESALDDPDKRVQAAKVLLEFAWGKPAGEVAITVSDAEAQALASLRELSKLSSKELSRLASEATATLSGSG